MADLTDASITSHGSSRSGSRSSASTAPASRFIQTEQGPEEGGPQAIGRSCGGLNTKTHLVASSLKQVLVFCLSPGQAHDAPVGRELLESLGIDNLQILLIMDRAYEGNETRYLVSCSASSRWCHRRPAAKPKAPARRRRVPSGSPEACPQRHDSLYLLDLMRELASKRAAEIRARGLSYFSGNNYNRVTRLDRFWNRLQAPWMVYRFFGYRISPLRFIVRPSFRRLKDAVRGSTVYAWLKPKPRDSTRHLIDARLPE